MYTLNKALLKRPRATTIVRELKKVILFGVCFGGLKLNAISMALILSNHLPSLAAFGQFEYALSVGLLLTVPFNLGIQGAIPYYLLTQQRKDYLTTFYFHGLVILAFSVLVSLLHLLSSNQVNITLNLALSIGLIFSLQILASIIAKTSGKIYQAVILEGALFLLLNGYNGYIYFIGSKANLATIQLLLYIQLGLLAAYFMWHFIKGRAQFEWSKYKSVLAFGRPIAISSILIMGLTGTGRIVAEYFLDLEAVALYGIYFRLAALTVLVHQVVNIVYFKKLYASNSQDLDLWFSRFLIIIVGISCLSYFVIPTIAIHFFDLVKDSWSTSASLYILLGFQMFYWIALALYENIIAREKLTQTFNKGCGLLLIGMLCSYGICYWLGLLSTSMLIAINTITIYLAIELQQKLLSGKATFPQSQLCIRTITVALVIYLIIQF